ncbi:unnamed protein product [Amoebophrya sp. A25]|nr:unnamed protein product [Amoebophrya sp. A25]|eukprot:GSA25T00013228001.1
MGASLFCADASARAPAEKAPDVFRYLIEPRDVEKRCIFCAIANGRMNPGKNRGGALLYQDEFVSAFDDIEPGAQRHVLIVPRKHVKNCWADNFDPALRRHMAQVGWNLARGDFLTDQPQSRMMEMNPTNSDFVEERSSRSPGDASSEVTAKSSVEQQPDFSSDNSMFRMFYIRPPWNSVYHVHLHVMRLPLRDDVPFLRRLGFSSPRFHITPEDVERERADGVPDFSIGNTTAASCPTSRL